MNVKKICAAIAAILCAAAFYATDIETALQQTVDQFSTSIKKGTTIAIVGISSGSPEMSDFMLDEITLDFVKLRQFTVANRANLDAIKKEMNFQLSGEVSDDSIQQLGAMVGASVVIHGKFTSIGKKFNLIVQVLDVTSAAVIDMVRIVVEPNSTTNYLLTSDKGSGSRNSNGNRSKSRNAVRTKSTKYSGDIQIQAGWRRTSCDEMEANGFYIGGTNYNLFNISDSIFSIGFMESMSVSLGSNLGFNLVVGPAIGWNSGNIVKFQFSPGLKIGYDDGFDEDEDVYFHTNGIIGFSLSVMVKFITSVFSPIFGIQYDIVSGHYSKENDYHSYSYYYGPLHGFNVTLGICFNLGSRR